MSPATDTAVVPRPDPARALRVVLISPYEIGRQPFGLAEPAAWLRAAGFDVACLDLAQQRLDPQVLADTDLVALYLAMHTATRIAVEALPRLRELAPHARLAAYGLYAPVNESLLRELGVEAVLGGEIEAALVEVAHRVQRGETVLQTGPTVTLDKLDFIAPARDTLPALSRYASLQMPDGSSKTVAFAEASRGCKHLCRHCPVVPVYNGRFRIVPVEVVVEDVATQVAMGASHVSYGDPDFLNGPTHALRVVRAVNERFPTLTFDATVKVEHLIGHSDALPELASRGCLFLTSAVEAVDDAILDKLAKHHTNADFSRAVALTREMGIAIAPTFVAFTPWTDVEGYIRLLARIAELRLVESVPPVQLAIRLLVPAGSKLLELADFADRMEPFDARTLGYPWRHPDPAVDVLQQTVMGIAMRAEEQQWPRSRAFAEIWQAAHATAGRVAAELPEDCAGPVIPRLSEPWYCCAEPTEQQLQSF